MRLSLLLQDEVGRGQSVALTEPLRKRLLASALAVQSELRRNGYQEADVDRVCRLLSTPTSSRASEPPGADSVRLEPAPLDGSAAPVDDRPVLLNYAAVARVLGVHQRTVERMVSTGDIEPVRVGRRVLFRPEVVDRLTGRSAGA